MDDDSNERIREEHVRTVREGHGANCSSVGSVVDMLFVGAVAGGALLTLIAAAVAREPIRIVGSEGANAASEPSAEEDE